MAKALQRPAKAASVRPDKVVPRQTGLGGSAGRSGVIAASRQDARAAKAAARRDAILEAALDEFSAKGFASARLEDVAKRAGIAKGTIYLYFTDKESLFQELIRAKMVPVVGSVRARRLPPNCRCSIARTAVEIFVREVFGTRRKLVIRLMISEGPRFPALSRDSLSRGAVAPTGKALRGLLRNRLRARRTRERRRWCAFPMLLGAPGIIAIVWAVLFERWRAARPRARHPASLLPDR